MVVVVTPVVVGVVVGVVSFVFVGFWVEDLGEVESPAAAAASDADGGGVE